MGRSPPHPNDPAAMRGARPSRALRLLHSEKPLLFFKLDLTYCAELRKDVRVANEEAIQELLKQVAAGTISPEEVIDDEVVDRVIQRWSTTGDFHEGLYGFR